MERSGTTVRWLVCALAMLAVSTRPGISAGTRTRHPPAAQRPDRGGGGEMCSARLSVRQTQGAEGCFIDERVTQTPGVLRYPCDGGPAEAVFGASRFVGRVEGGVVDLTLRTGFHYGDGCDWQSTQHITGTLVSHRLAFAYTEAPVAGQRGCLSSCRAAADVTVE